MAYIVMIRIQKRPENGITLFNITEQNLVDS